MEVISPIEGVPSSALHISSPVPPIFNKKNIFYSIHLQIQSSFLKFFLSEFFGTFLLIFLGCSVNAQCFLTKTNINNLVGNFGWGLSVMISVYATIGSSGGHLNPAVSLSLLVLKKINLSTLLYYWIAQYLGAFVGATFTYIIYSDAILLSTNGSKLIEGDLATAHIWATYPRPHLSLISLILDQIIGTAILLIGVMSIIDTKNSMIPRFLQPFLIGLLIILLSSSVSFNSGGALNPARDFSPRLFTYFAGWGKGVFTSNNYFFWVPLVFTHPGAVLGTLSYQAFIGNYYNVFEEEEEEIERNTETNLEIQNNILKRMKRKRKKRRENNSEEFIDLKK